MFALRDEKTETEAIRKRERERERETDRQTDRDRDRQRDREACKKLGAVCWW